MSNRKPHNDEAGYVAEKIFRPTGAHVVIYVAEAQGIDVDGNRYAVVCSKHSSICGVQSVPKARVLMKYPEFCERCMAEERTPNAAHRQPVTPLSHADIIAELEGEVLTYQESYREIDGWVRDEGARKTIAALKVAIEAVKRCNDPGEPSGQKARTEI